jgi:hypothetical protein
MNDEQLRRTYKTILEAHATAPSVNDVSPEALLALAEGRGPEAERLRTLDHVMRSEDVRREFELLRAAVASSRPPARVIPRPWLAAASLLIVVAGSAVVWRATHPENVMRGDASAVTLSSPSDAPSVSGPLVFAWRRVPGAVSYEIELVEASGTLVQMATVKDTSWTPPATVHLAHGVEYRWWVRATLADGRTLEAPPRRLVLSP